MKAEPSAGGWLQRKRLLKQQWSNLTDEDLETSCGQHDQLLGKILLRYGIPRDEAEEQLRDFDARVAPNAH